MRDSMTNKQTYYFGRAVAYVITMVHSYVNISKTWNDVFYKLIETEEEFRSTDRFHYIFEDLYSNSRDDRWKEYFKGVKRGIEEVMKSRGIKEDGTHLMKMKNSKKMLNMVGVVNSFLEDKEKEKFVIGRNEEFSTEKAKIYVTSINVIYKMQKIRNATYMGGLAEDIGSKISKNGEVVAAIGKIIGSFGSFINNFGVKLGGVVEIPEEIIGVIPTSEDFEGEVLPLVDGDEEIKSIDPASKKEEETSNLDKIKSSVIQCKPTSNIDKASKKAEEEKIIIEKQNNKRISMKDFNMEEKEENE